MNILSFILGFICLIRFCQLSPLHSSKNHLNPTEDDYKEEKQCAKINAQYYEKNFDDFTGEPPTDKLKVYIKSILDSHKKITYIDVGANMGQLTKDVFFDHSNAAGYLFEPNPQNWIKLKDRYASNQRIRLYMQAVSNKTGSRTFFFNWMKNFWSNQMGSFADSMKSAGSWNHRITVDVVTLDEAIPKNVSHIHLVKTDTEGFDALALFGGKRVLKMTDIVLFECHRYENREFGGPGTTRKQVQEYLRELQFEVYLISLDRLIRFDGPFYHASYDEKKEWMNCLALKKDYPSKKSILSNYEFLC